MKLRALLHRRCDTLVDGLAEAAEALTGRAERAEADLETAEAEAKEVSDDLMCTEHDLEQAHERLRDLKNQFERVLENAYAAGTLCRTWALLWSSLDEDTRQVLDTAAQAARIPDLGALAMVHPASGLWGSDEPERCPDPFCQQASGLLVVRHRAAQDRRARMLCTACGRHWGLPRYLTPVLDQGLRPAGPDGGRSPLSEVTPAVLAAADAALPPVPEVLAA